MWSSRCLGGKTTWLGLENHTRLSRTVRYDGQLKTKLLLLTNGTQTHGILRESPTNDPSKLPQQTLSRLYQRCSRKTYDVKLGASIVDQAAVRDALGARADRQEKKHRLM